MKVRGSSRTGALCGLLAVVLGACVSILRVEWGETAGATAPFYRISVDLPGADPQTMERLVTDPLEAAVTGLPGIRSLRSSSEYGSTTLWVEGDSQTPSGDLLSGLSEALDQVRGTFPTAAQRPILTQTSDSRRPVWAGAVLVPGLTVDETRARVDRELRPTLESLDGVASVEVSGGSVREIQVTVDVGIAASFGLGVADVARAVQSQGNPGPAGSLSSPLDHRNLTLGGKWESLEDLAEVPVSISPGISVPLSVVGNVAFGSQERKRISRVDGEERVVVSVFPSGDANWVKLSEEIHRRATGARAGGLTVTVLADRGADLEAQLVRNALVWAVSLGLGLGSALVLVPGTRGRLAMVVTVLTATMGTLALFGLTRVMVTPEVLGMLAAVSAPVIVQTVRQLAGGSVVPSVAFGLLMAVFSGFRPDDGLAAGGLVLASLGFLVLSHLSFRWVGLILDVDGMNLMPVFTGPAFLRHPKLKVAAGVTGAFSAMGVLFFPTVVSLENPEGELSARWEFPSATSVEAVDSKLEALAKTLRSLQGVCLAETLAQPGSGNLFLRWNPESISRDTVRRELSALGSAMPESLLVEDFGDHPPGCRVVFQGEDPAVLRDLARKTSKILDSVPGVSQVLLNFKEPAPGVTITLNPGTLGRSGVPSAAAAQEIQWALSGPVAVKWVFGGHEYDVRVRGIRPGGWSRGNLQDLPLGGLGPGLSLGTAGTLSPGPGVPKIDHENRRRTVSLTVVPGIPAGESPLASVALPPGYSARLELPSAAPSRSPGALGWPLGMALILLLCLLGARYQSPRYSFVFVGRVLPALVLPVLGALATGAGPETVLVGMALTVGGILGLVLPGANLVPAALPTIVVGSVLMAFGGAHSPAATWGWMSVSGAFGGLWVARFLRPFPGVVYRSPSHPEESL